MPTGEASVRPEIETHSRRQSVLGVIDHLPDLTATFQAEDDMDIDQSEATTHSIKVTDYFWNLWDNLFDCPTKCVPCEEGAPYLSCTSLSDHRVGDARGTVALSLMQPGLLNFLKIDWRGLWSVYQRHSNGTNDDFIWSSAWP